jgi:hypothetical protein
MSALSDLSNVPTDLGVVRRPMSSQRLVGHVKWINAAFDQFSDKAPPGTVGPTPLRHPLRYVTVVPGAR